MLVPRPISSISTRLCAVALCRMLAVSLISTMKVDWPRERSSPAPMRVKMRSIGPIVARAGRHVAADVREQHDQRVLAHVGAILPPMFGPVIDQHAAVVVERRGRSARTARRGPSPPPDGGRARSRCPASSVSSGAAQSSVSARSARVASTSSSAIAAAAVLQRFELFDRAGRAAPRTAPARASASVPCADSTLSSKAFSSSVM